MPYAIHYEEGHYDVIRKADNKVISRHSTRKKAVKAIQAIYIHERKGPRHKWFATREDQQ